jgi:hypothetical protein
MARGFVTGSMREGPFLDRHANFRDFPSALLVLFRMSTGESWNGIMHDCMNMEGCLYVPCLPCLHVGTRMGEQHAAVSTRPPNPSNTSIAIAIPRTIRTPHTCGRTSCLVQWSSSVAPCQTPLVRFTPNESLCTPSRESPFALSDRPHPSPLALLTSPALHSPLCYVLLLQVRGSGDQLELR